MNEGDIRVRGLEAIRKWVSKDERYIRMIGESEIIVNGVSILGRRTIGDGEEGEEEGEEVKEKKEEEGKEEGVSVREKNGILGIVLEVVEGGGWRGSYEELEEAVGRLEEEGKKRWMEKRREEGGRGGREWKEMGRLARDVLWGIEERRGRGERGEGEILTFVGMKKNLEEEKKGREEEKRLREESEKNLKVSERQKKEMEERLHNAEREMAEIKKREEEERRKEEEEERKKREEEEKRYLLITSLDGTSVTFPQGDEITTEGNTITHHGTENIWRNCFIGGVMTSVWHVSYSSSLHLFHFLLTLI